jgi:hypothetical protein
MKRVHFVSVIVMLLLGVVADAQSKRDEEALRRLPKAFSEAWAKHRSLGQKRKGLRCQSSCLRLRLRFPESLKDI